MIIENCIHVAKVCNMVCSYGRCALLMDTWNKRLRANRTLPHMYAQPVAGFKNNFGFLKRPYQKISILTDYGIPRNITTCTMLKYRKNN